MLTHQDAPWHGMLVQHSPLSFWEVHGAQATALKWQCSCYIAQMTVFKLRCSSYGAQSAWSPACRSWCSASTATQRSLFSSCPPAVEGLAWTWRGLTPSSFMTQTGILPWMLRWAPLNIACQTMFCCTLQFCITPQVFTLFMENALRCSRSFFMSNSWVICVKSCISASVNCTAGFATIQSNALSYTFADLPKLLLDQKASCIIQAHDKCGKYLMFVS